MKKLVATGPADIRDQRWLDERIAAIDDGVQAVLDIAYNWTDGRHLARLHPGVSAAEYVTSRVGTLGRSVVPVLLAESDWSNRQIAEVAGISHQTVGRMATGPDGPVERGPETLGADGKLRRVRVVREVVAQVIEEEEASAEEADGGEMPIETQVARVAWRDIEALMDFIARVAAIDTADVAATVPERRRAATARRLRTLGTDLGRIALFLERMERDA